MTLNQLFYSLGRFCLDLKNEKFDPKNGELIKTMLHILEEKFAKIEEKSTTMQSETSVLKERLFLSLVFTLLTVIEKTGQDLKDINRTIEVNLFSFAKTRFKCLNSSIQPIDC